MRNRGIPWASASGPKSTALRCANCSSRSVTRQSSCQPACSRACSGACPSSWNWPADLQRLPRQRPRLQHLEPEIDQGHLALNPHGPSAGTTATCVTLGRAATMASFDSSNARRRVAAFASGHDGAQGRVRDRCDEVGGHGRCAWLCPHPNGRARLDHATDVRFGHLAVDRQADHAPVGIGADRELSASVRRCRANRDGGAGGCSGHWCRCRGAQRLDEGVSPTGVVVQANHVEMPGMQVAGRRFGGEGSGRSAKAAP